MRYTPAPRARRRLESSTVRYVHASPGNVVTCSCIPDGNGDEYVAPVRPIVIGDALLRLAEKVVCKQMSDQFKRHLMPHQVGVAVKGGLNMWATVVECLLQCNVDNVVLAIDLENMFDAVDRDALVDELLSPIGQRSGARGRGGRGYGLASAYPGHAVPGSRELGGRRLMRRPIDVGVE